MMQRTSGSAGVRCGSPRAGRSYRGRYRKGVNRGFASVLSMVRTLASANDTCRITGVVDARNGLFQRSGPKYGTQSPRQARTMVT